jgi:hypothetical protein
LRCFVLNCAEYGQHNLHLKYWAAVICLVLKKKMLFPFFPAPLSVRWNFSRTFIIHFNKWSAVSPVRCWKSIIWTCMRFMYLIYLDIIHRPSFSNKTQHFRDWLYLRPQVIRKGEVVILSGGSLDRANHWTSDGD